MAAKKGCLAKLKKEYNAFFKDPPPHIPLVAMNEKNILEWHYLIEGPPGTPYEGGWYIGKLKFPADYPFKPPAIMMLTPSGRFQTGTRLCLSMSDFHPETWNPMWSVSSVLTGLLSFMLEDTGTTGSVVSTDEEKHQLAAKSVEFNLRAPQLRNLFPTLPELARKRREERVGASQAAPPASAQPQASSDGKAADGHLGGSGGGVSNGDVVKGSVGSGPPPAVAYAKAAAAAAAGQFYSAARAADQIMAEYGPSSYGHLLAAAFHLRLGNLAEARHHISEGRSLSKLASGQSGTGGDVVYLVDAAEAELRRADSLLRGDGTRAEGSDAGPSSSPGDRGEVRGTGAGDGGGLTSGRGCGTEYPETGADPEAALSCFERAINKYCTHSARLLMEKARSLVVLGELDTSVATLEEAAQMLTNDPSSSHLRLKSAEEPVTSSVVAEALARARTAARQRARGNEQFRKKNYVAALKAYDSALASEEDCAVVYCNRAAALAALERYEEALVACDRALALNSKYSKARRRRADSVAALNLRAAPAAAAAE